MRRKEFSPDERFDRWGLIVPFQGNRKWHYFIDGQSLCERHTILPKYPLTGKYNDQYEGCEICIHILIKLINKLNKLEKK